MDLTLQQQLRGVGPPPLSPPHWSGWWGWSVWQWRWRLLGVGAPCWLGSCGEEGQAQEPVGSQWPWEQSLHTVTTTPDTISVILSHAMHIGKLNKVTCYYGTIPVDNDATAFTKSLYWIFSLSWMSDVWEVPFSRQEQINCASSQDVSKGLLKVAHLIYNIVFISRSAILHEGHPHTGEAVLPLLFCADSSHELWWASVALKPSVLLDAGWKKGNLERDPSLQWDKMWQTLNWG